MKLLKIMIFSALLGVGMLMVNSCKEELPSAMNTSDKFVNIESIKLTKVGEDGSITLEGSVDEEKKEVTFPRIDPKTDFSNLKFDVVLSQGAKLDKESYSVTFEEGVFSATIRVIVQNLPRTKEYYVKLEQKVPPIGTDFDNPNIMDYSGNPLGQSIYTDYTANTTRHSAFDGDNVLIVSRGSSPHILKVSDLRNGVISKRSLLTTGLDVTGATFTYNSGAIIGDKVFVSNASSATVSVSRLKIFYYSSHTATGQTILNDPMDGRVGDGTSFSIDRNGNGFVYFGYDNNRFVRYRVSNFTTVSDKTVLTLPSVFSTHWKTFNQAYTSQYYLFTSHQQPINVANESGVVSYTMKTGAAGLLTSLNDPKVVVFNKARYLIAGSTPITGFPSMTFYVYDITAGATIEEALKKFDESEVKNPVFQYSLLGDSNGNPIVNTGYAVKKDEDGNDEKLLLYAAGAGQGFAIFEFSKKTFED